MRLQTQVVSKKDDNTHWLSVEVENDVATFYLDEEELFSTDFEGNFDEFAEAIMILWGDWIRTGRKKET